MRPVSFLVVTLIAAACATTPGGPPLPAVVPEEGGYFTGAPRGLGEPEVVNRRDLVYALAFSGDVVAFVHHVTTNMELTAASLDPVRPLFQQPVNSTEFDVEDVLILDDVIVVPSRQGVVRAFDAATGALTREHAVGEALVRAAIAPDKKLLALGSAEGRVFFVDATSFAVRGSARPHKDEVRGLAFLDDNRIITASFDKTAVVSALSPPAVQEVRVTSSALKTGERVFLAHLADGARAISTVRDTRQPATAVTAAAVTRLELAPVEDGTMIEAVTAAGAQQYPAVELGRVRIGTLDLGPVRAAVCDLCVPAGAELVLGGEALARATFVDDIARDELLVKAGAGSKLIDDALTLSESKRVALPGPATDVDVSRTGQVIVSFSAEKAERSYELYEREKKNEYPEPSAASGVALLDVDNGALGKRFIGHRGFTVTAGISPDGKTIVSGGWDKRVLVFDAASGELVAERKLAWLVRRVRFSPTGRLLGVAAWTPVNAFNQGDSDPALLLYPMVLDQPRVANK